MEETTFHPLDYVSVLRRRLWWLLVPLVLAIAAGAGLAVYLPKQYQATATLGVSSPKVSEQILANAPRITPEERARAIAHQLRSDAVLARAAREEGLLDRMSPEAAVAMLRAGVQVSVPPASQVTSGPDTFYISYRAATPDLAQRVTNRVATVFVEETSRVQETRAEDTTAFIDQQLRASKDRLQAIEARLRDAKEAYMGSLPEQTDANLRMVAGLQQQLESNATAMRGEQDRLSIIERQIDALQQGTTGDAGVPPAASDPTQSAAARVIAAEQALAAARSTYTDRHPEVQRLRDELQAARAAAAAEQQRPAADRMATLRMDPTYRNLIGDRERARLRIAELQTVERNLRAQVAMYQKRVETAPRIEQQFAAMQREYDLEKQQHAELTAKRNSAGLVQMLQQNAGGERFTVLYPATRPSAPFSPNIPRLMVLSVLAGLMLGIGFAAARQYLDRAVYDTRTLQREYALPVLGEIPRIA